MGIRQDTGAAAEDHLYDVDTVPPGSRWPLVIELDLAAFSARAGNGNTFDPSCLCLALQDWTRGRCWLGRGVARGLGWMTLDDCQVVSLSGLAALTWADDCLYDSLIDSKPRRTFSAFQAQLLQLRGIQKQALGDVRCPAAGLNPWHLVRLTGTISIGQPRQGGWGLDTLSIGGHDLVSAYLPKDHTLAPPERAGQREDGGAQLKPLGILKLYDKTGQLLAQEPFVPGSSIRGPLRHQLSRGWRQAEPDTPIADPITGLRWSANGACPAPVVGDTSNPAETVQTPDAAEALFGSARQDPDFTSSRLLVKDALLTRGKEWKQIVLQSHAEDEFKTGTFGGALFQRLMLVDASFEVEMVIEDPCADAARASARAILDLLAQHDGHGLAIGGGQWRGHGGVLWKLSSQEASFGKDWPSPDLTGPP